MKLLLDQKNRYLLGCSFGPDSMALLGLLLEAKIPFEIAHVNYHQRGDESEQETKKLTNFSALHNIPLHIFDANYRREYGNFEAWARNVRYNFFADLINANPTLKAVLIAHHQDDLIETYLLQIARQNRPLFYGLASYTTINSVAVFRPLLNYSRLQLRAFCLEKNIPFSDDSSNKSLRYARNRIRLSKMEKLTNEERSRILTEINEKNLANTINRANILNRFSLDGPLEISKLIELNLEDFSTLIFAYLAERGIYPQFSLAARKELFKLCASTKPNLSLKISGDWQFLKAYRFLYLFPITDPPNYSYQLDVPGKLDTPYFKLDFTSEADHHGITITDYPLTIRSPKRGDTCQISQYQKKVSRLFIDWKMPQNLRLVWPIFVNKQGVVVFVPRFRPEFQANSKHDLVFKLPYIC